MFLKDKVFLFEVSALKFAKHFFESIKSFKFKINVFVLQQLIILHQNVLNKSASIRDGTG